MLSFLGFLVIAILLFLVLTKRTVVHFPLTIIPVFVALIAGFSLKQISGFVQTGIAGIAATGIMLTFAVLYFGIMFDAGMFDPIIKWIIKTAKGDPVKIAIGTAVIAVISHLDGSGASTFLITVSAMLPIYKALGMKTAYLAVIAGMGAGTMNMVPWGGPTLRAATSLGVDVTELFNPLAPILVIGVLTVLVLSYLIGKSERNRLGTISSDSAALSAKEKDNGSEAVDRGRGEKMIWVNIGLTIVLIYALVKNLLPMQAIFILGVPLALVINYPQSKHAERIQAHAKGAIYTASIIFSAGIFTGILRGAEMIKAMTESLSSIIPTGMGGMLSVITGVLSMPLSLFFDPDSFYFGVLPVLAGTANELGIQAINMGRAAILGQMTTGFPASPLTGATWLLIGLAGIELGDLQKELIPRAFIITLVMTIAAKIIGVI